MQGVAPTQTSDCSVVLQGGLTSAQLVEECSPRPAISAVHRRLRQWSLGPSVHRHVLVKGTWFFDPGSG